MKQAIQIIERAVAALDPNCKDAKVLRAVSDALRTSERRIQEVSARVDAIEKRLSSP